MNEDTKDKDVKKKKKQKEVKMIVGYDATGKAIRKSFYHPTSKKKAVEKGLDYIDKQKHGLLIDEDTTFEQ
jgi:putative heme degradation protein